MGFDWDHEEQVWEKVQEELLEFKEEVDRKSDRIEEEFGDLLFSLINYSRFINVNPENALERTNKKFISRFQLMETLLSEDAKTMSDLTLNELDEYWNKSKQILKS